MRSIEVEARQVTACTFGGPDLDRLYITTSRENLEPDDDPLAGSLFTAVPGVRGLPVRDVRRLGRFPFLRPQRAHQLRSLQQVGEGPRSTIFPPSMSRI